MIYQHLFVDHFCQAWAALPIAEQLVLFRVAHAVQFEHEPDE